MKIAIVFYRTLASQSSASLTASYLASYLRIYNNEVKLFLLDNINENDEIKNILAFQPEVMFYKPNFKDTDFIEQNFKKFYFEIHGLKLVLFGPFAVLNAKDLLTEYPFISGILLPNHEPLTNEILVWLQNDNLEQIPKGLIIKRNNTTYFLEETTELLQKSFDSITPAKDIEENEPIFIANIEASRGCIRGCTFCHVPAITNFGGNKILLRTPEKVIEEMISLYQRGKKYIIFNDSILGGGTKEGVNWLYRFCNLLLNENLQTYFMAYFTLNYFQKYPELISNLGNAGLIRVFIGIESADEDGLKKFRKGVKINNYEHIKKLLVSSNIVPHIGFMLFHPFATVQEIRNGLTFLYNNNELHRFGVILEATRLIPYTKLYNDVQQAGLMLPLLDYKNTHNYKFQNCDTGNLYNNFQSIFKEVGVPMLERIEHLFVTGEFLINLNRKKQFYIPDSLIHRYTELRSKYCLDFLNLCYNIINHKFIDIKKSKVILTKYWNDIEYIWGDIIFESEQAGLEKPLDWIPTGDLSSEINREKNYNGKTMSTRSGKIIAQ